VTYNRQQKWYVNDGVASFSAQDLQKVPFNMKKKRFNSSHHSNAQIRNLSRGRDGLSRAEHAQVFNSSEIIVAAPMKDNRRLKVQTQLNIQD
jgi:hypothetical protein